MFSSLYETGDGFHPIKVMYTGTDALKEGEGLCYDADYTSAVDGEAATDPCLKRTCRAERGSATNNMRFAGVVVSNYDANPHGMMVEVYPPGSMAYVLAGVNTVLPVGAVAGTILTCSVADADSGRFSLAGYSGRGTAQALETDAGVVKFTTLSGTAAAAYAASVTTITDTGIGTASAVGDRVVVLGGADVTTGGDVTTGELATEGIYAITAIPSADTVQIATDIGDVQISCYVLDDAEHTILAYLQEGPESGLQEFITPQDAVAVSGMTGGVSFLAGGYTMTADSTYTLADGVEPGIRKAFAGLGAITTGNYVITVTSGIQRDGTSALNTATFDAANEFISLVWEGSFGTVNAGYWKADHGAGYAAA